jgi:hypothetical protein
MVRFSILLMTLISIDLTCNVAETHAGLISVDFSTLDASPQNTGYSANRVQSGFSDFSYGPESVQPTRDQAVLPPPGPGGTPTITMTFGSIDVTLSDPGPGSNGLIFVDDGSVSGGLGMLAEDYVIPSGLNLRVNLAGLPAGSYLMTTYHHLPQATTENTLNGIAVDNGSGTQTVAQDVPVSIGFAPTTVSSSTFQFDADGSNDVLVTVRGRSFSTVRGVLNGFEVSAVPEPSTCVLFAFGALGLLGSQLRRRRRRTRVN